MFFKQSELDRIKERFERWRGTSDFYRSRLKQIEEFVPLGRSVVQHAAHGGSMSNDTLTGLIQVLQANASNNVLEKYLPYIYRADDDLKKARTAFASTALRGFTGAGKKRMKDLSEDQLEAVERFLVGAEGARNREDAVAIVKRFEAVPMKYVKSGIFSPWLHYLNPALFPISNGPHKEFRRAHHFPEAYSDQLARYWELADALGTDLGVLDAFIYSEEESETALKEEAKLWKDASWMSKVSREHWDHFLDMCDLIIDRFELGPEDPVFGITPRTDNTRRVSFNLGNRLVFGLEHKLDTLAIIMLEQDALSRHGDLTDWGAFDTKPDAHLWTLPYARFVEMADELMSECLTLSGAYVRGKGRSSYRKSHEPDLYRMAVDDEFRQLALDHMLDDIGEWPGGDEEQDSTMEDEDTRRYFKYSPGEQAVFLKECLQGKMAMVGHRETIGSDMTPLTTRAAVYEAAGKDLADKGNRVWNLWLFRDAKPGDVVFASKGTNTCVAVGIIDGDYYFTETTDEYPHRRPVKWITDKVVEYKPNQIKGTKSLFRFDTFSPAKAWRWILAKYVELHPELADVFESLGLDYEHDPIDDPLPADDPKVSEPGSAYGTAYWWLNANPSIWSITKWPLNKVQTYTSHNDKGNKRKVYKHFQDAKAGDLVVGYESSPTKQVKGIFKVTRGLYQDLDGLEKIDFELVEKFTEPIPYEDVKRSPELSECEPMVNNQGSLFKLTAAEYEVIRELIDSRQERVVKGAKPYDFRKDPDKPFLSETEFINLLTQLRRKKNLVLQGPPGVGKTFIARKLAHAFMGECDDNRIEMVQFHQSTSYEDFVQGLRPAKNGGFELRNGVFYTFCKRAQANPDKDYFFIIDEINRGNLSKILGELLLLIEADKRDGRFALKLTYAEDDTDTFWVPPNIHLIGTMNTADRSLAIVDYALRRRFAFVELQPDLGAPFSEFLRTQGLPDDLVLHLVGKLAEVNRSIREDRDLGTGFQIGHSYFCGALNGQDALAWYNDVLSYEIKPLLLEIWFDAPEKAMKMLASLQH